MISRRWLAFVAVGLVGCTPLNQALFKGLHPYAHGMRLTQNGKYDEAIEQFRRVDLVSPEARAAQFAIGVAMAKRGDEEQALDFLLALRERDPQSFDTAHWPGDVDSTSRSGVSGALRLNTLGTLFAKTSLQWTADSQRNISQLYSAGEYLVVRAGQSLAVLSKVDRTLKWEKDVYSSSWVVPAIDATTVYVVPAPRPSRKPVLEAIDLQTGRVRWSRQLNHAYQRAAPALDATTVYIGDATPPHDGTLYALDKATGAVRWSTKAEGHPGPIAAGPTHVCTQGSTKVASCFERRTGKRTATQDLPEFVDGGSLAMTHTRAFFSSGGATYAVNVSGGEAALAWKTPRAIGEARSSALTVVGSLLVAQTTGGLVATDMLTGARTWLAPTPEGKRSGPEGVNRPEKTDTGVVGWADSWAYAVDTRGALQWALRLGEVGRPISLSSNPVADADGTLYVPTRQGLFCFKARRWVEPPSAGPTRAAAVRLANGRRTVVE
ncbi:MAG: PQQ-binding-like beta-propeller repeat protein [Archangium sp.]|nr:PQQ-binding-like beta-propeller repeat protein [Archangium sp.]